MAELTDFIGAESEIFYETITPDKAKLFAQTVHAQDSTSPATTYITRYRHGEFELVDRMGIGLNEILHAEQEYTFERPLPAGVQVGYFTKLSQIQEKKGKTELLVFITLTTDIYETSEGSGDRSGPLFASSKTLFVLRRKHS